MTKQWVNAEWDREVSLGDRLQQKSAQPFYSKDFTLEKRLSNRFFEALDCCEA